MPTRPAKVTFTATTLIWFRILGEKKKPGPFVRDDGGIVGELLRWQGETKTFPLESTVSGGGMYIAGYSLKDAVKVRAWLIEHGVKEEKR